MHGCANDYVVVDATRAAVADPAALARAVCDRRSGIGSDGLLLAESSEVADLRMRMFNPDGSEAEMCGNGLRCLVLFAVSRGRVDRTTNLRIETGAGVLGASLVAGGPPATPRRADVVIDMGMPRFERGALPMSGAPGRVIEESFEAAGSSLRITALSMGNPHVVLFVDDVDAAPVDVLGPAIETHPVFPQRTNVSFVEVRSPTRLRLRTWERGVGETQACGTGACAAAVAGVLTERSANDVTVEVRGGRLQVHWNEMHGVRLTGPATLVYEGRWPVGGGPSP